MKRDTTFDSVPYKMISSHPSENASDSNVRKNEVLLKSRDSPKAGSPKVNKNYSPLRTRNGRPITPVRTRGEREISPMRPPKSPIRQSTSPKGTLSPMRQSRQPRDTVSPLRQSKTPRQSLSPKRTDSKRVQRTSFQGLSIIEGKDTKTSSMDSVDKEKVDKMKKERRRRSIQIMRNSAQSTQIRDMLENTLEECEADINIEDVEDRLKAILTKAKETGMTTEQIFSFFNGGNPNTTEITKESFLSSIEKFGQSFTVTDKELSELVKKFDKNNDNHISLVEFQNYCYHEIQSIAWKAERTRLEKNGEMKKLKAQLSRQFSGIVIHENSCGIEVFRSSKLFWKTNNTVEIRYFFTNKLNIITMQMYSQAIEKELPCLFICKNKVEKEMSSRTKSKGAEDAIDEDDNSWEAIAKELTARLKIYEPTSEDSSFPDDLPIEECSHIPRDTPMFPFLAKLSGDTMETLQVKKPLNLIPPPPISSGTSISEEFDRKMDSFVKTTRMCRSSRRSAQGLSNILSSVLTEINCSLGEDGTMSKNG
jgi:hypothetical protein